MGAPKQHNLHPGYDPDLFLEALKQRHDALAMITDRLEKRHAEQEERQRELDVREQAGIIPGEAHRRTRATLGQEKLEVMVSDSEKLLLRLLEHCPDNNTRAVVLQSFIADHGPLSEEAGEKVRAILSNR